jgi:hypothetical protein
MKLFSRIFKTSDKKKELHMDIFTKEYCDSLIAEHKLVSATITHLQIVDFKKYASTHGHDKVQAAIASLSVKKVELEGKIDVLLEYLN